MSAADIGPVSVDEISQWSAEVDVVVAGFGCAGASAAIEAARAGVDVLVMERAGGPGGAAALSGGEIYLGGGTAVQHACGYDDSPEAMFSFLMAACGPNADGNKIAAYTENSVAHFDWLVECGVPFNASMWNEPTWVPPTDDGLMWMGENSYPFTELAKPAPRGHRPRTSGLGGWLLMERLSTVAHDAGVRTWGDTMVERLVIDPDGRVVGVLARRYGATVAVRARRGVILTAGGFVHNEEMLASHAPALLGHAKVGTDYDDGRAILMAQAAGAAVRHMGSGQTALQISPALLVRGILVNAQGQRFINEDTYPGRVGQVALFHHGAHPYLIIDETGFEAVSASERRGAKPVAVCASVAELEHELRLPPLALQTTVDLYNRHSARGSDPVFHKNDRWCAPLGTPIAAIDVCSRGTFVTDAVEDNGSGFAVFTLGGLHTSPDGEVLSLVGEPIAGLYAAGRTTSGIHAWGYISGTSLGDGTYFGRRAGKTAAASSAD